MVSIILSVNANSDGLLVKTLDSIAKQSYHDWELIAVDDGSTDNTEEVLRNFQKAHRERVIIINNEANLGLTKSLILAATKTNGKYLARIDSGDEFMAEKLQKQIQFLEQHIDYGLVGCNYINTFLPGNKAQQCQTPKTDNEIRSSIIKKNPFAHSCIVMRKNIYMRVGGYDPLVKYGQDYDLWFRILKTTKAANLQEFLCHRTVHENSISYNKQRAQMRQCLKTQWKHMDRLNPISYLYLFEPLLLILLPEWIKRVIRQAR